MISAKKVDNRWYWRIGVILWMLLFSPAIYASGAWGLSGDMNYPHRYHSATLLQNAKILVAGGNIDGHAQAEAELWDPASGVWSITSSLNMPRAWHSATLLNNGKVLVAGGSKQTDGGIPDTLASAELYDPATGHWQYTGSMLEARSAHTAVLLDDGRVLVLGGQTVNTPTSSVEIYNPNTGSWTAAAPLAIATGSPSASKLNDGRVLVVLSGGETQIYDPVNNSWTATGPLHTPRFGETTLLADGRVLFSGGFVIVDYIWGFPIVDCDLATEIYDPNRNAWRTAGNMVVGRTAHATLRLPDGKVLAVGNGGACPGGDQSAEVFDPATGAWTAAANTFTHRSTATAVLTQDGNVLLPGGSGLYEISLNSTEIYSESGALSPTPPRAQAVHIVNLEGSAQLSALTGYWAASVTFTVHDDFGNPANNVEVSGTSLICTTNALGQCTATDPTLLSLSTSSISLSVTNLQSSHLLGDLPPLSYDASANSDLNGNSDGTTIIVNQDGSTSPPPPPPSVMHINNLNSAYTQNGDLWRPKVAAVVVDNYGDPVAYATVTGTWGNGLGGSGSCITATSGVCWISYPSDVAIASVPNPTFTITDISKSGLSYDASLNSDADGNSDGTTITILAPAPLVSMHVGDLDGSAAVVSKRRWQASVRIYVRDNTNLAVSGATVTGSWSAGVSGTASCITNGAGYCSVNSGDINTRNSSATFTVTNLSQWQLSYSPDDNTDPDGDSTGTSITVQKP